ncbi:MAG: hypothetical protein K6G84_03160 [Lachnospiraceae bacterium]|nr:hypothetical protein [Lachnospiraceae bacterium]
MVILKGKLHIIRICGMAKLGKKEVASMWYVIQVKGGEEQKLKLLIESRLDSRYYRTCLIPLYESVRRRKEKCLIMLRRLLPGYILIDTDHPVEVHKVLKSIPDFTKILGTRDNRETEKEFIPIGKDDEEFFESILDNGIMHASYVHLSKANRIDKVLGPLEKYIKYITKMEYRHRYATIEAEIFGKKRKIDFGLWGDGDPRLPWIEELRKNHNTQSTNNEYLLENDLSIHVGDKIMYPEVYGDTIFTVDSINHSCRIIRSTIKMFGCERKIELFADDVQRIG